MISYAVCLTQQVVGLCRMLLCDAAKWLLDLKTSRSLRSHLVATISLCIVYVVYLLHIVLLVATNKQNKTDN